MGRHQDRRHSDAGVVLATAAHAVAGAVCDQDNRYAKCLLHPPYEPTFEHNKQVALEAERQSLDFILSMMEYKGFGGETSYWDNCLETFTLMAGLAAVTEKIGLFPTVTVLAQRHREHGCHPHAAGRPQLRRHAQACGSSALRRQMAGQGQRGRGLSRSRSVPQSCFCRRPRLPARPVIERARSSCVA